MPQNRKLDYLFQKPDPRDLHFMVKEELYEAQPPSFRLIPQAVNDQGSEGSCGPNSIDSMLEYQMHQEGKTVVNTSRQFTYWITRELMGTTNQDSGVDNRTMLKALAAKGFLIPESKWPYSAPLTAKPSQECFTLALPNRISNYAMVEQNEKVMKATLIAGEPFLFGFSCYEQLMSDECSRTGLVANPAGRSVGGHDVMIFAYDDNIRCPGARSSGAFLFQNSWGEWGMDGSGAGAISYEYATDPNQAGDFWVINALPGGITPPGPPTPPSSSKLFSLTFNTAVRQGGRVSFSAPVPIPAGKYDVVPSPLNAMIGIGDRIANLLEVYGWRAIPFIKAFLDQFPLEDKWRVKIMDVVTQALDPATEVDAEK